jgi:hypothetical protein
MTNKKQKYLIKFLGVNITNELTWSKHTKTVVKMARQNLFPLRRLKRFGMGPQILKRFYICTIESILGHPGGTSPGPSFLPSRTSIPGGVRKIVKDSSHPSHRLFSLLPHGKQNQSAKSRSKRLLNRFLPPTHKTPEQLNGFLSGTLMLLSVIIYA